MSSIAVKDAYQLMNAIVKQATGSEELTVVDTSSFVAVGNKLLNLQTENTLNAITTVLAETIFSVRPYKGKLESLRVGQRKWGAMVRKLVPLLSEAEQSQDWNTDLAETQLADGNSIDMYKINAPKMLQLNFTGTLTLQKHITRFRDQLSIAFSNEAEFLNFIDAVMIEFANEVELLDEAKTRTTLINFMAGISSMGLTEVDLTKEYNTKYGTQYTREQLLSTYLDSFIKFVAATIKTYSKELTDMSVLHHANITGMAKIPRHTPVERQKMIMYAPLFTDAEANVFSSIFNPSYLNIGSFEEVNYWQSQTNPSSIKCTPNILDIADGSTKKAETEVNLDYVVGILFDDEAIGVMPQFDYASTTPFNSAGGYYNMYVHWRFNLYNDFTENAILFVMGAGGEQ